MKNALRKISHSDGLGLRCIILEDCYNEVKEPDLAKCAKRKDFGQGFYLRLLPLILPEFMEDTLVSKEDFVKYEIYKEAVRANNPEALVAIIKMIYQRKQKRLAQGKSVLIQMQGISR